MLPPTSIDPASPSTAPSSPGSPPPDAPSLSLPELIARSALGGFLMGLANLVPGISGGTMLVVSGIFTHFIAAIAEVTSFRRPPLRAVITLAAVIVPAALAILLLAGPVRNLVVDYRWIMYSLFIGWTLGGVPTVWAMCRAADPPAAADARRGTVDPRILAGAALGLAIMVAMVVIQSRSHTAAAAGAAGPGMLMFFAGGIVAAAAMVLPGVSGGYLLLLLGLYIPILDTVDQVKSAVHTRELTALPGILPIVIPLGLGIVVGIVGVSHIVRWLLRHFEKITMGALLGLLLGAFLGLYPFQQPVEPEPGSIVKGQIVSREALDAGEIKPKDWPVQYFAPSPAQVGISILLIAAAAASTLMIARVGHRRPARQGCPPPAS